MTTTVFVTINDQTCANCGIVFGLSSTYEEKRRNDHATFYCPNGHSLHFSGESKAEKAERLLKWERDRNASLLGELDGAKASLRTTKGVVTKMRKRAIAGSCQFCHRHFTNVARHVASQHPTETA